MYKPVLKKILVVIFLAEAVLAYPDPDSKAVSQQNPSPTITTPLGSIQGSILATRLGTPIYAFRGIRYAKAPINELRFQPPVPVEKWEGIYNATIDGPACPQPDVSPTSEDCLLLNVYTTMLPKENEKRPVMVFFHGGGYHSGSANSKSLGPKYLLDHDIVLVVPNYRLGSLGFISTGDKEAPGNNGLKDQLQALKWTKENIVSFGGNPDSVTLAGHGVGGASVTLHLVSPLSKGLFHRAIAMSGSSTGNWPVTLHQLDLAKKQAKLVDCPDDTSENIMKCLKEKPAEEIANTLPKFREFGDLDPHAIWLPVVEKDFGQSRFLTRHPTTSILGGDFVKVPFLAGIANDEFADHAYAVMNNPKLLQDLNGDLAKYAPIAFMYERYTDVSPAITNEFDRFYFKNKPLDNSSLPKLAQVYDDALAGFGVNRAVALVADKNNESVYYYRFSYKGRHSHFYLPDTNNSVPYGVAHRDDLIYLFHNPDKFPDYKENDPEIETIEKMTKLWTNFVKTGNPTPEQSDKLDNVNWEPFRPKVKQYLDIGSKLVPSENLHEKRYDRWSFAFILYMYQQENAKRWYD